MYTEKIYEIQIIQKSNFPRRLPFDYLLLDDMETGADRGWYTSRNTVNPDGFVAYYKDAIGRGIRVKYHSDEFEEVILTLKLPANEEEIHAFCLMAKNVKALWTSSVLLNGCMILEKELNDLEEIMLKENETCLNRIFSEIQQDREEIIVLQCAMYRLMIGKHEVQIMQFDDYCARFRNWMHTLQKRVLFIPKPEIMERRDDLSKIAIYTIPENVPVVFPTKIILREQDGPASSNIYSMKFDQVLIKPYFTSLPMHTDYYEIDEFLQHIPPESVHYYDAGNILIDAISPERFKGVKRENN